MIVRSLAMTPTRDGLNGAICTHDLPMVLVMRFLQHQRCHLKFALELKAAGHFNGLLRTVRMQLCMIFGHETIKQTKWSSDNTNKIESPFS
jgi:hypothetical protein